MAGADGSLGVGAAVAAIAVYLSNTRLRWAEFPESDWGRQLTVRVNDLNQWVTDNFRVVTKWINDTVSQWLLDPLQDLLANTPWWLAAGVILALAGLLGGVGNRPVIRLVIPSALVALAVLGAGMGSRQSEDDREQRQSEPRLRGRLGISCRHRLRQRHLRVSAPAGRRHVFRRLRVEAAASFRKEREARQGPP